MHPLYFLASRTLVNGIKRSFSSPTRTLGTLFFLFSQLYWVGSTLFRAASSPVASRIPFTVPAGAPSLITAVVVAFFAASSWLWGLGLFSAPFGFQKADSDCLFPTPVKNSHILNLHLVRNTLFKVLFPLVGTAVLWRPVKALSIQVATGQVSTDTVAGVFRTGVLVYLLLMTLWTLARYASVLTTAGTEKARMDLRSRLGVAVNVLTLASLGLFAWMLYARFQQDGPGMMTLVAGLNDRRWWWLQPVGALGALTALGPVDGSFGVSALALAALVAIAGACAQACYRSAGRLSELGLQSIDVYEKFKRRRGQTPQDVVSEKASRGGYQTGLPKLLSSWAVTGESAFVWRDMVLLWRTARLALVLIFAIIAVISGVVGRIDTPQSYYMLAPLTMVLVGAAAASNMAQAGMKEFLKRNDMVRPLPLSVSRLLRTEALSRSALGVVAVLPGIVTWAVIMPWSLLIAPLVVVFAVGTSFALVSVTTLTCILLPDIEDPTQRSFRQLIQSLGMMLCLSVVVGSFVGLVFATKGLAVPCVVAGVVGGLIGLGALRAAESAYAAYVPSE